MARVVGSHRVLGRVVPKLRPLGRVPLGASHRGRDEYHWNGRVGGRRIGPGTYVITFRGLTRTARLQTTSQTIAFRVTRRHRIASVHALR